MLFDVMHYLFILTGQGLGCFTSFFTGSSLLAMVCIVSLDASLVHHHWSWFVLFHFMLYWFIPIGHCLYFLHFPHWFINTGHDFYCFTSLTGSSLLGMVYMVSIHASLVHHHCFASFDYALHGFFLTGDGLYCFSSCFIGSSLLSMVCVVSRHASPVHPYWAWFVLFHCMLNCFLLNGHSWIVSIHASLVHSYLGLFVLFRFPCWFFIASHGL